MLTLSFLCCVATACDELEMESGVVYEVSENGEFAVAKGLKGNGTIESIEIAETMSEEFPDNFSRQRDVKFSSLKDDIYRRDFTINSLLMKFNCGENINSIIDISGYGIKDLLENKIIRCIPQVDTEEILYVDPLRILRAIRFSIRYNYNIDEKTLAIMKKIGNRINILSKERIYDEIKNIGKYKKGIYKLILLLDEIDCLKYIFPEVYKLKFVMQSPDIRMIHMEGSEYYCKNFEEE
jgi:tRNA nucleotidyltransferase/poly(A) polymerase